MYFIFICLAIAEVYSIEGDNECSKGEYHQAIGSYTEGIKVNCKDEKLNAKLFTNRATVHYHLGENNKLIFGLDVFICHFFFKFDHIVKKVFNRCYLQVITVKVWEMQRSRDSSSQLT